MVGPSKILTVSYGTFSCTLEGFDDPFSTMRGIAEYFRDLAADDRYFGAEPPTPDAEMLHRIAEREIHRRVEARVENNGIILRQMDGDSKTPPSKPEASTAPTSATAAGFAAAAAAPRHTPKTEVETYDFTKAKPARGESVAAKLARIRASVAQREDDAGQTYRDESHVADTLPASKLAEAFEDRTEEIAPEPEADDIAVEPEASDAQAELAEPEALTTEDEAAPSPPPEIALAEEETDEPASAEMSQDDAAQDDTPVEPEVADQDVLALKDQDETGEDADGATSAGEDDGFEGADAELPEAGTEHLAGLGFQNVAESELEEEDAVKDTFSDSDTTPEDTLIGDGMDADEDEAATDTLMHALDRAGKDDDVEDDALFADEPAEAPDAPAIARIMKLRRADFEDEPENQPETQETSEQADADAGSDDDDDDEPINYSFVASGEDDAEDLENVFVDDEPENDLSEEDEAGLMATLEQVQRDSEAEDHADKEGRAVLERQDLEGDGNGVQRILDVTNTELEETEGTRRRSAIQHLKAAVMATRADKKLSKDKEAQEETTRIDKFREDLARVVRPRRPADGMKPTERRQAPLVLVSEQRVDKDTVPEVDPNAEAIRPRRVSASVAAEAEDNAASQSSDDNSENAFFSDAESFVEFAEQMDATELPDLLEAAAAYASYVEGRPHFSRPQIMRAVAVFDRDGDFNREDSLRSFGQLLRHGKIRKLSRGQFTVAQSTRFNPGARAAGE